MKRLAFSSVFLGSGRGRRGAVRSFFAKRLESVRGLANGSKSLAKQEKDTFLTTNKTKRRTNERGRNKKHVLPSPPFGERSPSPVRDLHPKPRPPLPGRVRRPERVCCLPPLPPPFHQVGSETDATGKARSEGRGRGGRLPGPGPLLKMDQVRQTRNKGTDLSPSNILLACLCNVSDEVSLGRPRPILTGQHAIRKVLLLLNFSFSLFLLPARLSSPKC